MVYGGASYAARAMPRKFGIARIPADSIVPRCGKFVTNFPGKCASNRDCWSLHEY